MWVSSIVFDMESSRQENMRFWCGITAREAPRLLAVAAAAALACACNSTEDVTSYVTPPALGVVQFGVAGSPGDFARDPLTVDSAAVRDGRLHVFVSYAGGCAGHEFAALAENTWLESNPVQLSLLLAHNAHGDTCEALLHSELRFDLTPVRQAFARAYHQAEGEVVLRLVPAADPGVEPVLVHYSF